MSEPESVPVVARELRRGLRVRHGGAWHRIHAVETAARYASIPTHLDVVLVSGHVICTPAGRTVLVHPDDVGPPDFP